ncbi:hypothetical protein LTR56_002354 [Elasticomyces elasticus]|nr:hypothetical protein LTR56_002354 [Elasticomyces elasticus]KAK3665918.1 hypothetical protein LTR22_003237 [Elasticomyces elasticus]KAK4929390.1 hypothetical protein LTR49_003994 [Elasticomyces elasticus]KAK5764679.1 hypothetical protein LTS12_005180 [Elasticomyces elasticus]
MVPYQTLEQKLQKCINDLLRKEFPYTHASDINGAAASGAAGIASDILARKRTRKDGVRPLEFLDLPPEIRNLVYEYTVKQHDQCRGDNIVLWAGSKGLALDAHAAAQPAITRVSWQLRHDTLSMFYGLNKFAVLANYSHAAAIADGSSQACRWLRCIGAEKARMIKNFTVLWIETFPLRQRLSSTN